MRENLCVLTVCAAAFAADDGETLSIRKLAVPFGANDQPACVSLPEDGKTMVYQSRRADGFGGADLWLSRLENGSWSRPQNAGPSINSAVNDVDGKFSADGSTLVFIRGEDFRKSSDIYVSYFRNGAWTKAEVIGPPVSLPETVEFGASLSRDGKRLYFSSNRAGGHGGFDHYYSEREGSGWGKPVNFGDMINTAENEVDVAVTRDGNAIIFPAKRSDSIGGSTDLYISRFVNGAWTALQNMGPRINTPGTDNCPWLGYDGRTLYLDSDWDGLVAGAKGLKAIWEIRYSKGF
jgi:Tol biopolymer transport system component